MDAADRADDRREMVKIQLIRRGIRSAAVLDAMGNLPRELFLPAGRKADAYGDHAVSIACDQTMSQPYMVALMTQALDLDGRQKVLEIGTGSGYQTAVLAALARTVISMERHGDLSLRAQRALDQLGYQNIRLVIGDGARGFAAEAPFDRILVTAAAPRVPEPLLEQLAEGGILVIPVGAEQSQVLQSIRRVNDQTHVAELADCRFVPLVSGQFAAPPPPSN